MLSHNEYVIWTIENKTLRSAVGICNNAEQPMVYLKDLNALKKGTITATLSIAAQ